jgi:hypothetical protein
MRYWLKFSQLSGVGPTFTDSIVKAKREGFTQIRRMQSHSLKWAYLLDFENNRKCCLYVSKDGKAHQTRWRVLYKPQ